MEVIYIEKWSDIPNQRLLRYVKEETLEKARKYLHEGEIAERVYVLKISDKVNDFYFDVEDQWKKEKEKIDEEL